MVVKNLDTAVFRGGPVIPVRSVVQRFSLSRAAFVGRGREAGAIAHKLKSSSRSVGAIALGDLCAELENAGKAGGLATLATWAKQFDTALAAVEGALEQWLAAEVK